MVSGEGLGENLKYFVLAFVLFVGGNWMLDSALVSNIESNLVSHRQQEVRELLALGHVEMDYLRALRTLQAAVDIRKEDFIHAFSPFAVPEMGPREMLEELEKPAYREKVENIISNHGFFSVEDWVRHWYSLLMSAAYYDGQMRALKNPDGDHRNGQITIPRPPEKNLRAVALLLQNEDVGKWLRGMVEKLRRLRQVLFHRQS